MCEIEVEAAHSDRASPFSQKAMLTFHKPHERKKQEDYAGTRQQLPARDKCKMVGSGCSWVGVTATSPSHRIASHRSSFLSMSINQKGGFKSKKKSKGRAKNFGGK